MGNFNSNLLIPNAIIINHGTHVAAFSSDVC